MKLSPSLSPSKKIAEYEEAAVTANIEAALEDYLSTQSWPWEQYVRYNELITLISNVEGVDYVNALTAPATDVDLGDTATLTTPGTITITFV